MQDQEKVKGEKKQDEETQRKAKHQKIDTALAKRLQAEQEKKKVGKATRSFQYCDRVNVSEH